MSEPFKVIPYGDGEAKVVDRETNLRVGYVVRYWRGWRGFVCDDPDAPGHDLPNWQFERYRKVAVARVWHHRKGADA